MKDDKEHTITICMGSSCFSRGNKKTVGMIQQYLKTYNLEANVMLKGSHCMGDCDKGPAIKIDDQIIYHLDLDQLEEILHKKFFAGVEKPTSSSKPD